MAGLAAAFGGVQGTGVIQGQIDFTVFDRDRSGEAQELAQPHSTHRRSDRRFAPRHRRGDQRGAAESRIAAEQIAVAEEGQKLATRELELAQDRFQSGTTNNVEVVTAQDELARAEENYILAVTSHADAKFALARAVGDTENNIGQYLGNP